MVEAAPPQFWIRVAVRQGVNAVFASFTGKEKMFESASIREFKSFSPIAFSKPTDPVTVKG